MFPNRQTIPKVTEQRPVLILSNTLPFVLWQLDPSSTLDLAMPHNIDNNQPTTINGGSPTSCYPLKSPLKTFSPNKLKMFTRYQVALWDEPHKSCDLRMDTGASSTTWKIFSHAKWDENGKIGLIHGTYRDNQPVDISLKYICFGVARVLFDECMIEGRWCELLR